MRNLTQHGLYALLVLGAVAVILPAAGGPAMGQTTWYVDVEATTHGDGEVWDGPFEFLQEALQHEDLTSGDDIWVAGGVYYPDLPNDEGNQTVSFVLVPGVTIKGGYHGQCSGVCGDPALRDEVSILSGDINGGGPDGGNSQHVVRASGLTSETLLDRFTIRMGYADGTSYPHYFGGGLLFQNCANIKVDNCRIENNYSYNLSHEGGGGGAMVHITSSVSSSVTTFEDCVFDGNNTIERSPGLFYLSDTGAAGHSITLLRTDFTNNHQNHTPVPEAILGGGGGAQITNATALEVTECEFIDNDVDSYAALYINSSASAPAAATADIDNCTFDGNTAGFNGAAIYNAHKNLTTTITDCTFKENEATKGAGAIYALVKRDGTLTIDVTDCDFLRNTVLTDVENTGGGAVFLGGLPGSGDDGILKGTWTRCNFIENSGFRGGAVYLTSTDLIEIEDCKFISNHSFDGGGAICVSDLQDFTTTELLICNSDFIGNTADTKGGAVYNRGGATTTMVNCIVAGNKANSLGGGTCNADDFADPAAPTVFNLHNCLLAGNWAATPGNQGGGHLNRDNGVSELINCTVVLNEAVGNYGGIENVGDAGVLEVQNCIVWGNDDDAGNGGIDNQLHFSVNDPEGLEVDQNVIEGCTGACFPGSGNENQGTDPYAVSSITSPTWTSSTYDADTGITTFNITVSVSALANESLFLPDSNSPLQLLIESVDTVSDTISCYGKWTDLDQGNQKTGTIFDYHIASGSVAVDYGDANHLPLDLCDLDGDGEILTEKLSRDFDVTPVREQGQSPDSGAYETGGP